MLLLYHLNRNVIILLIILVFITIDIYSKDIRSLDKGIIIDKDKVIKIYDSEDVIVKILGEKGIQQQDWHFPEFKSYFYYDEQNKIHLGFGLNEHGEIVGISLSKEVVKPTFEKIKPFNIKLTEKVKTLKGITLGDNTYKVKEIYGEPTYMDRKGDILIYRYYLSKEEAPNENIKVTFGLVLEFINDRLVRVEISDGS